MERGIATKGIFDKADLLDVLISYEKKIKESDLVSKIPLQNLYFGSDKNVYIGINLKISKLDYLFMIDTGATMNLMKKEISTALGLTSSFQQTTTVGSGGVGLIGSSVVHVNSCKVGNNTLNFNAAVLENSNTIPSSAAGLVGLGFLHALVGQPRTVLKFDFQKMLLLHGPKEYLLTPSTELKAYPIEFKRIYAGLLAIDVYVETERSGKQPQVTFNF